MARVSVREKRNVVGRQASRGRRPAGRGGGRAVRVVVLACAALSMVVALDQLWSDGEIRPGVHVGDVALGGKTPEEAREVLGRRAADVGEIRLTGPEGGEVVSARELGFRFDAGATVERAYAIGREGGLLSRLADRAASPFGTGVPAAVDYANEAATRRIEALANRHNAAARDASVTISGADASVAPARRGYELDEAATLRNLESSLHALSNEAEMAGEVKEPVVKTLEAEEAAKTVREAASAPVLLTAGDQSWSIPGAEVGPLLDVVRRDGSLDVTVNRERTGDRMAQAYSGLVVEPTEAGYSVEGTEVTVTPGREGQEVEEEKLLDSIEGGLFDGVREYEVPVIVDRPELTTGEAERLKPTEMLGSYRTNYAVVPDDGTRVENLSISSDAVNGTLLAPGKVFSMNRHVSGLDYNESKVIVGGQETTADGGGLCQVTSTLYNAANFAGLDVVERTPHSAQLPYIRPGMDATVWWGGPGKADDLDMKFRNTTDGYLLLRQYVAGDGHVYAEIWGQPDGTEVEMHSEPSYMGANGSEWVTHQKITRGDQVLFDGVLHKDSYAPLKDQHGNTIPPAEVPVAAVNP